MGLGQRRSRRCRTLNFCGARESFEIRRTTWQVAEKAFCGHPERSEGSAFCRKAKKKADSSSPTAPPNDMNENFSAAR